MALDILHVMFQDGVITALAFLPLLVVGAVSPKRKWLFPVALWCTLSDWLLSVAVTSLLLLSAIRNWSYWEYPPYPPPYRPLAIGRSLLSFEQNAAVLAVTLWIPAAIGYVVLRYLAEQQRAIDLGRSAAIVAFLSYAVVAAPWSWMYSMEATYTAPGFSRARWNRVDVGMSRTEVEAVVGPPIHPPPRFAQEQGGECWVANYGDGHYACVWFRSGRAERTLLWYSD